MTFFILAGFLLLAAQGVQAQQNPDFFTQSMQLNQTGMYVLGSWALLNLGSGAYGWATQSGHQKYFWQMNTAWNLVNAGIAGYALYSFSQLDLAAMSGTELWQSHQQIKRLYLINAGLDILYMGSGAWLIHMSGKNEKRHDLYKCYGQSIILQGAFLFVFDLAMYGLQHRLEKVHAIMPDQFTLLPGGLSLVWHF